jgi:hypothetical protein
VRPKFKPDLEGLLEDLREKTERAIEKVSVWRPDRRHFYCPECLVVMLVFEDEKERKCPTCRVKLRPVDEYFRAEYARALRAFCEKASKIVERIWPVLESWTGGIKGYMADEGFVEVFFGEPRLLYNMLGLLLEGRGGVRAVLAIHNISERELDKLVEVVRALREEGVRGKVEVRADCPVPEEKMKSLGFEKISITWHLEL